MDRYTHNPLSTDDSIRVLELLPGLSGDTLEARLLEVRLSDEPIFSALSYCWGAPIFDALLVCNAHALHITKSLATALNCLRNATQPLVIWIDQVCINQGDLAERNRQVQLMSRIYASAYEVLVWLGLPTDSSNFMFHCMSRGMVMHADIPRLLCSIAEFCHRHWFERTWTVQEVVLSRYEPRLFCGRRSVSWSQFGQHLDTLYQRFSQRVPVSEDGLFPSVYAKSIDDLDTWKLFLGDTNSRSTDQRMREALKFFLDGTMGFSKIRAMRAEGPSASFPTQLLRTLHLQVTDQRDKVFGLLGMCVFESDSITPDYSKSVTRVYSEAMAHIILNDFGSGYPSLSFDTIEPVETQNLPTWVANFAAQSNHLETWVRPNDLVPKRSEIVNAAIARASHATPIVRFSDDFQILYTYGVEFSSVKASFSLPQSLDSVMGLERWERWFSQIVWMVRGRRIPLESILESLHRPHSGRYDHWDTALSAFKRLFNFARKGKMFTNTADVHMKSLLKDLGEVEGIALPFCLDNTFFITGTRRIGRCIGAVAQGGLFGINIPFILRKKDDAFSMVSIAHVAGHHYNHISIENANGKSSLGNPRTYSPKTFTIV
ncbi:HET-domain-containing protein [Trematosphaeria pertusa]|uniref:HET-domain-containing protein n=1 Tax=Trematosphaeria pertusa TaxID=390896 RepID=A0A6A6HT62_9PLEO|nr:HET-domain-containing protein [Trematosphaeria pertusa]KAF2240630.1 HET-domain-containing protein [Trematosphaeria pertusa]